MILTATPGKQPEAPGPLAHLYWVWFSVVMGLAGLALAWSRASHLMGEGAIWVANALGVLAAVVWLALAAASLLRLRRYPRLIAQDLAHPVRHAFVAAIPVGLLLLCAVAVGPLGPRVWIDAVWVVAAGAQFLVTVWVLGRWLHEPQEGQPSMWLAITPALFIPVVGNVVAPLAGIPLGHTAWSLAQMGLGAFFWPLVMALVLARRAAYSALPARLLMSWFITVAPPSVLGVVTVVIKAPVGWSMALWGVALFCLIWAAQVVNRAWAGGFHMGFWAVSFPLAAFTGLTLMLAERGAAPWMGAAAMVLLVLTSVTITWLTLSTLRGLRQGTLLVAEPAPPVPKPA